MGWRKAANSVWLPRKEMQEARQEVRQAGALWAAEFPLSLGSLDCILNAAGTL